MDPAISAPPYDQLLQVADTIALERPEVDLELAREVFLEAATLLYNGLALDGLDDHDANAAVAGLCVDLVTSDPGEAIRVRSQHALDHPSELHDPTSVSRALLIAASLMKL